MSDENEPLIAGLDPEDLDGHTLDELDDYLAAGRRPVDPSIESSAGCQLALEALQRLRSLTPELIAAQEAAEPPTDESWVQSILLGIAADVRPGRRIPLPSTVPTADLAITEAAVRGIVRSAENALPGVLIGRCRILGDITASDSPVTVEVDVSITYGSSVAAVTDTLRAEIAERLRRHTDLVVQGIDITVRDIQPPVRSDDDRT